MDGNAEVIDSSKLEASGRARPSSTHHRPCSSNDDNIRVTFNLVLRELFHRNMISLYVSSRTSDHLTTIPNSYRNISALYEEKQKDESPACVLKVLLANACHLVAREQPTTLATGVFVFHGESIVHIGFRSHHQTETNRYVLSRQPFAPFDLT
jgi:hypothetical protein